MGDTLRTRRRPGAHWIRLTHVTLGLLLSIASAAYAQDSDADGLSDEREAELGSDPHRVDTDGDYLPDAEEDRLGTDLLSPDSDSDGLPDYTEVVVYGTDPLRKDTDGGGTIDGEEALVDGTDPRVASDDRLDSDQDGLSNRKELALGTDPFAKDTDGDLLTDGEEDANHDGTWAGDLGQTGVYEPSAGDETNPVVADSDGDGLRDGLELLVLHTDPFALDSDGDNVDDGEEVRQRDEGLDCLDPAEPDSDYDGLDDGWELSDEHPSNPCSPDGDGDGIYDAVERADGTDPRDEAEHNPDADGDHLSDAYEVEHAKTDPAVADSDGDGLLDGEEVFPLADRLETDALDADTDDDGLLDGNESRLLDGRLVDDATSAVLWDTDHDGLSDGLELGLASPQSSSRSPMASDPEKFVADADPSTTTDPLVADGDEDGLDDGVEDANRDGRRDADETDPADDDTDGDGLDDGWEAHYADLSHCARGIERSVDPLDPHDALLDFDDDGLTNRQEYKAKLRDSQGERPVRTSPCAADTDGDGLSDPSELRSEYGDGPSDPTLADSDGDGLSDGLEDANGNGRWDQLSETDPTRADTDGDRLADGQEDIDHDGSVGPDETDPRSSDTDGDGIDDGSEGLLFGTDPLNADTDGDGLSDGIELALFGDADPTTSTDPTRADTDGDGLDDGVEDADQDGEVDPGESHPRLLDTDGAGVDDGTEVNVDGTDPTDPTDDLTADPDGDGLSNRIERTLGTDPLSADSDGDFVSDGTEVGEDPDRPQDFDGDGIIDALDDDSDADGLSDAQEAGDEDLETPVPDTDADGFDDLHDTDADNGGVPDGIEALVHHTNPLDPSDDMRGWFEAGASVRGSGCSVGGARAGSSARGCGLLGVVWLALVLRRRSPRARRNPGARRGRDKRDASAGRAGMLAAWLIAAAWPRTAAAQEHPDARMVQVDGSPYRMNPSGDVVVATSLPTVLGHMQWQVSGMLHHFADSILVVDSEGSRLRSILDNRQQIELAGALGLFGFAELGLHWAIAPHQAATFPGQGLGKTDSWGVTHPVLHPKLTLLRQPNSPLSLGVEVPLTLAFWTPQAYMGRAGFGAHPNLLAAFQAGDVTLATAVGVDLYPSARVYRTHDGPRLTYQVALRYRPATRSYQAGLEWSASHRLGDLIDRDESIGQAAAELGYRILPSWTVRAIAGVGLLAGLGQPQYRILAGATYRAQAAPAPAQPPPEPAGPPTGLQPSNEPACAQDERAAGCHAEPTPVDRDKDGWDDAADSCPDAAEDRDGFADEDGCPDLDNDEDGIADVSDRCPLVAGSAAEQGCPEPETVAVDETQAACPTGQVATPATEPGEPPRCTPEGDATPSEITQTIHFESNTSALSDDSTVQLQQVLEQLELHPSLTVRIEGHSDATGAETANRQLSLQRANNVRSYLIAHAKDPGGLGARLSAVGVGETQPVDTNQTEEGRAHNRCVRFVVGAPP